MYTIFTDGACNFNKKGSDNIGSYAFVILNEHGNKIFEFVESEKNTTNNRMELKAVIYALKHLKDTDEDITVNSDSMYVVNCINDKWYINWHRKNWKKGAKDIANRDLWEELLALAVKNNISFTWIKGHSTNIWNNYVDKLAESKCGTQQFNIINR